MRSSNGKWASAAWLRTLDRILNDGDVVAPRGKATIELRHHKFQMSMRYPVVLCPLRKLSYTFLAAEALWILAGDDTVQGIAPYNPNIAQFSDDGVRFFGAYGPRIVQQLDYVIGKLVEDKDTRQAGLVTWRINPPQTKDVPCTIAMFFSIRNNELHCDVFMRSSDAWLGLPYDTFNFTMVALKVACAYNKAIAEHDKGNDVPSFRTFIELGTLSVTAVSSHLYNVNCGAASQCIERGEEPQGEPIPSAPLLRGDWDFFERSLEVCRDKEEAAGEEAQQDFWRIRP